MSLKSYLAKFNRLRVAKANDHARPHKVCMLLAAIDLIESNGIDTNRIKYDDVLKARYQAHFDMMRIESDQLNPFLPFFHLKSEGFWHHKIKPGQENQYSQLTTAGGHSDIINNIDYAYLDEELFRFLQDQANREQLKSALFDNLDESKRTDLRKAIGSWSQIECELIVKDYLEMLESELRGEKYNKTEHRRKLQPKLDNRTEGSIEFKHQNISAILIELGYPYIIGYKPAFNYQGLLKEVVEGHLFANQKQIVQESEIFIDSEPVQTVTNDWQSVLEDAPEVIWKSIEHKVREFNPRQYNFAERENRNRKLGLAGEEFVLEYEKYRLNAAGRDDLAKEVEWTSQKKGDGAGYDIRSFDLADEKELFIEVKTTNSGKYQPFLISDNEVAFSEIYADQYALRRVFEYRKYPKIFTLAGNLADHVNLYPKTYRASF